MFSYYDEDIIPIILNRFGVDDIVITGILDKKTLIQVFEYCNNHNVSYNLIDFKKEESVLSVLPKFNNYSAIFLNDDANWYTVYNELKIIKENSKEFPLVFICNNNFPNKRRDSYINPSHIPDEFKQDYLDHVIYDDIIINDGFFHANSENSSKNGVLTAIEDFLEENDSIRMMNIRLLNNITILYLNNSISQIRLNKLSEEIEGMELKQENLIENNSISKYIFNFGIFEDMHEIERIKQELEENKKIIRDYENRIKIHNDELNLKDSQIDNFVSKLDFKDSQIKEIESKLFNQKDEINELDKQIKSLKKVIVVKDQSLKSNESNFHSKISSLESDVLKKERAEIELTNKIQDIIHQNESKLDEVKKENDLKIRDIIHQNENNLLQVKKQSLNHLSQLNNKEYCISCYKEEISNNKAEITYLKRNSIKKKFLSPLAYIYLILNSNPNDLSLNLKLYKALKDSQCFDIGYYLKNNKDIQESKWCKYFSPQLHYVCKGFKESRKFNKKYFNRNSKKELLDYILNCQ